MSEMFLQKDKLEILAQFFQNENQKVCFLKGLAGLFKTSLVKKSIETIKDDYLIFNVKCFENTTLDDIFLSIFNDFKSYAQQKKVAFSKIETNSFALRMNQYLKQLKHPSIIVFDSLQNIFGKQDSKEKDEIINFIKYLISLNKFKIILISTYFTKSITENETISNENITCIETTPFSEEETKSYLAQENIVFSEKDFKGFFNLTEGNPTLIKHTINVLSTAKTSPENLLSTYKQKNIPFEEYLIQRLLTFIPEKSKHGLKALSLFNGTLPIKFLVDESFFTPEQINLLEEKGLIAIEQTNIYIKSNIKKIIQKSISNIDKTKIHTLWKNLYTSQLPLKPNERIMPISRNTMRSQIEYHGKYSNEDIALESNKNQQNLSLLSYINSNFTNWHKTSQTTNESEKKERPTPPDSLKNKEQNSNLEKYELTKNELALLGAPVNLTKKEQDTPLTRTKEQLEENIKESLPKETLSYYLVIANSEFDAHNYEYATSFYLKALNLTQDEDFEDKQPQILSKLAICCKKMNKTVEAIDIYNSLSELYTKKADHENVNKIKLEIAQIYKETYRIGHAKVIYESFINNKDDFSAEIVSLSYIKLAEIEDENSNIEKAVLHYRKAFEISKENNITNNQDILAESYFKYALIMDDLHQQEEALEFYEKCINTATKPSIFLSSSYSNAAEIFKERQEKIKAIEYYKKGLEIDTKLTNYEGIYYICLKLAIISENTDSKETFNWLQKSLIAAKKTQENLYITNSYIEIGDYYRKIKNLEQALKSYLKAQTYYDKTKDSFSNGTNPASRIDYIKKVIEKDVFERINNEVKNNE